MVLMNKKRSTVHWITLSQILFVSNYRMADLFPYHTATAQTQILRLSLWKALADSEQAMRNVCLKLLKGNRWIGEDSPLK